RGDAGDAPGDDAREGDRGDSHDGPQGSSSDSPRGDAHEGDRSDSRGDQQGNPRDDSRADPRGGAGEELQGDAAAGERAGSDAWRRLPTRLAVIAMGRFGGGELGYGSDADVMFVHEPVDGADEHQAAAVAF